MTQPHDAAAVSSGTVPSAAISVVATVRNERLTIREFVDSLRRQTLRPDEIIIVDGASTDGTREILSECAATGTIRLISQDCNIAEGRNLGIRHTRNELVAITDAGCRVDPTWLQTIAECFSRPEQPHVIAGNFAFDCRSEFERAVVYATFSPSRETSLVARFYPSSRSVAFRKSAWQAAKGYPEWLYAAEDTLFNIRLRQLGYRFVFCKDALVHWRPRESWSKLARQRFNFSRGNARAGIATSGYITNIQFHVAALLLVLGGTQWWPLMAAGLLVVAEHVRRHLWTQAAHAARAAASSIMFVRVLAVMEFVRIVNIFGFLAGKVDRLVDRSLKARQLEWMGVTSADELRESLDRERETSARAAPRAQDTQDNLKLRVAWPLSTLLAAALALLAMSPETREWAAAGLSIALVSTGAMLFKSFHDFTQTGPPLKREIFRQYRTYSLFALLRLALWAFVLCAGMAWFGVAVYGAISVLTGFPLRFGDALAAAAIGVFALTTLQFCRHLLYLPSSIAASSNYRVSRLYPLWRRLTPKRLLAVQFLGGTATVALFTASACILVSKGEALAAAGFALLALLALLAPLAVLARGSDRDAPIGVGAPPPKPSILMIGSDTLRADRVGAHRDGRDLTPFIDSLAARGTRFTECYVPCARTAPSLLSLMTGTWPQRHGVRDNFVGDGETHLPVPGLAALLAAHGYRTAAVSDWSGGDLGKFPLGFENLDLPKDQWNIKYLIRQGPKDLRLFLSLFTHNALGKRLLPELYYLAGVPLTGLVGRDARALISRFAARGEPFLLNVFVSTTHPPFGSEYPYYTLWSDARYAGESKFVMAGLTDPWEIIRRQADSKKDFDLDQVLDLYDGCVSNFDDEVKRIVEHLRACGLADNTIVVIYSDHGMEFFEHDTWGQGNSVRGDASARVPLGIVDPRIKIGGVCSRVVRSIDVAPTLLELAGIEPPADMEGVSLVPYLRGEAIDLNLPAFNETGIWLTDLPGMPADHLRYPDLLELLEVPDRGTGTLAIKPQYRQAVIAAKDRMVRLGWWKLIYQPTTNGPRYALFDLASDPQCLRDVAQERPDVVRNLKKHLQDWLTHEPRTSKSRERQRAVKTQDTTDSDAGKPSAAARPPADAGTYRRVLEEPNGKR